MKTKSKFLIYPSTLSIDTNSISSFIIKKNGLSISETKA
jgi:hypothetical protein